MSASDHNDILLIEDTTWTSENGEIEINKSVIVFPNVKLTIRGSRPSDPVRLLFSTDQAQIVVHPTAEVIVQDAVFIRAADAPASGYTGQGISFVSEDGGSVSLTRLRCQGLRTCINRRCCNGNQVTISDSSFVENEYPLTGYSGNIAVVKNSTFIRNKLGVSGADWEFEDCFFSENEHGANAERTYFSRTTFEGNGVGVSNNNGGWKFLENVVLYRNGVGVSPGCCGNSLGSILSATFLENEIGIQCRSKFGVVEKVNFINNTIYSVSYTGNSLVTLENVYWGTADEAAVEESIFDAYDDSGGGVVQFSVDVQTPFLHSEYSLNFATSSVPTPGASPNPEPGSNPEPTPNSEPTREQHQSESPVAHDHQPIKGSNSTEDHSTHEEHSNHGEQHAFGNSALATPSTNSVSSNDSETLSTEFKWAISAFSVSVLNLILVLSLFWLVRRLERALRSGTGTDVATTRGASETQNLLQDDEEQNSVEDGEILGQTKQEQSAIDESWNPMEQQQGEHGREGGPEGAKDHSQTNDSPTIETQEEKQPEVETLEENENIMQEDNAGKQDIVERGRSIAEHDVSHEEGGEADDDETSEEDGVHVSSTEEREEPCLRQEDDKRTAPNDKDQMGENDEVDQGPREGDDDEVYQTLAEVGEDKDCRDPTSGVLPEKEEGVEVGIET